MDRVKTDGPGVDVLVDLLTPIIWRPENSVNILDLLCLSSRLII